MSTRLGKASALAGSVMLAGAGIFSVAPLVDQHFNAGAEQAFASEVNVQEHAQADIVRVSARNVEGLFSFDQNTVCANEQIAGTFKKAVSALCTSMPHYGIAHFAPFAIGADTNDVQATLAAASEEGEQSRIMGCACSSNLAGGGAIVNARVSGVSLETLAQRAEAL